MAKWKWDSAHKSKRCGHSHCSDCRKRRGNNRGNRNERRTIRLVLRELTKL